MWAKRFFKLPFTCVVIPYQQLIEKLEERYLLGTRYVLEQGFTRGSGYQIITHVGYQTRELFDAWFIGRHILAKITLAPTQQAMMWYNATGRIFEKTMKSLMQTLIFLTHNYSG